MTAAETSTTNNNKCYFRRGKQTRFANSFILISHRVNVIAASKFPLSSYLFSREQRDAGCWNDLTTMEATVTKHEGNEKEEVEHNQHGDGQQGHVDERLEPWSEGVDWFLAERIRALTAGKWTKRNQSVRLIVEAGKKKKKKLWMVILDEGMVFVSCWRTHEEAASSTQ